MFFTQFIYNDNKNIYKFIKNVKWKKTYQRLFNKNTPLYAEPSAKQQNFWQLWSNLSERTVCCLKNHTIFFTERTHRLTLSLSFPPLFVFVYFLRTQFPPSTKNVLFEYPLLEKTCEQLLLNVGLFRIG